MPNLNDIPFLPFQLAPAGMDLGNVVVTPTGGLNHFVRASGPSDYDPPALTGRILSSINTAMSYCRTGAGDTIFVLPGHTESVSTAAFFSNLVAGTRIVGLGDEQNRPTLTWTATASTWLLNKANVTVENLRLLLAPNAGAVTVTAPITVSAAGVTIRRCYIEVGTTAARLCATAITLAAGADDFAFLGNVVWGDLTAGVVDCLKVNAAVNRPKIVGNDIQVATTANAIGPLDFTTAAAVDIQVKNNYIVNKKASSTSAITGIANLSGMIADNYLGISAAGAATAILTPGNTYQVQNFLCQPGKNGILGTDGGAST